MLRIVKLDNYKEDDHNVDYVVPIYVSLLQLYKVYIIFSFKNQSENIHIQFSVCHWIAMKEYILSFIFGNVNDFLITLKVRF